MCDFSNTENNDFISTPIAPITDAESCEINAALLNLVMKDQFAGLPSEDAATHLNSFVDLCDMQKKKDVDNDIVKLKQFPFSLRDRAKTLFSSCLSFSSPPLHQFAFLVRLFVRPFFSPPLCLLVCLLAC